MYDDDAAGAGGMLAITRRADPLVARVLSPCVREHQATALELTLRSVAAEARGRLVLVMDDVQQLTSAGVNALVTGSRLCRDQGGRMVLVGLKHDLVDLFHSTGLDRTLTVAMHPDDAMAYFHGRHAPARKWKGIGKRRRAA
jgi:anti-anti-sigma factor